MKKGIAFLIAIILVAGMIPINGIAIEESAKSSKSTVPTIGVANINYVESASLNWSDKWRENPSYMTMTNNANFAYDVALNPSNVYQQDEIIYEGLSFKNEEDIVFEFELTGSDYDTGDKVLNDVEIHFRNDKHILLRPEGTYYNIGGSYKELKRSIMKSGETHHYVIQSNNTAMSMWVDGELIIDNEAYTDRYAEDQGTSTPRFKYKVRNGTYAFENVKIYKLSSNLVENYAKSASLNWSDKWRENPSYMTITDNANFAYDVALNPNNIYQQDEIIYEGLSFENEEDIVFEFELTGSDYDTGDKVLNDVEIHFRNDKHILLRPEGTYYNIGGNYKELKRAIMKSGETRHYVIQSNNTAMSMWVDGELIIDNEAYTDRYAEDQGTSIPRFMYKVRNGTYTFENVRIYKADIQTEREDVSPLIDKSYNLIYSDEFQIISNIGPSVNHWTYEDGSIYSDMTGQSWDNMFCLFGDSNINCPLSQEDAYIFTTKVKASETGQIRGTIATCNGQDIWFAILLNESSSQFIPLYGKELGRRTLYTTITSQCSSRLTMVVTSKKADIYLNGSVVYTFDFTDSSTYNGEIEFSPKLGLFSTCAYFDDIQIYYNQGYYRTELERSVKDAEVYDDYLPYTTPSYNSLDAVKADAKELYVNRGSIVNGDYHTYCGATLNSLKLALSNITNITSDINKDGYTTKTDIQALRKELVETEATDVNGDGGNGNVIDLVRLIKYVHVYCPTNVYVKTTGINANGYGTKEQPYQTLEYALKHVANEGTITILDFYTANSNFAWEQSSKKVTISGGTIDFASINGGVLRIGNHVTFTDTNLILPNNGTVYACGNTLKIDENVTVTGVTNVYGGDTIPVANTDITLLSGRYNQIYGGGHGSNVNGNTNVYISGTVNDYTNHSDFKSFAIYGGGNQGNVNGNTSVTVLGNVNANLDYKSHDASMRVFGGSYNGIVNGKTEVTIGEGAKFNYVYGGGNGSSSKVNTSSTINFDGYAMGIYGGSAGGWNRDTYVNMIGGWVEQVFGGCDKSSMEGNTDVKILAGTVYRRIYGGCYNDFNTGNNSWLTDHHVSGYTNVTIDKAAEVSLEYTTKKDVLFSTVDVKSDNSLYATSRYQSTFDDEIGVFIFTNNSYSDNSGKIGYTDGYSLMSNVYKSYFSSTYYHYLVKVSSGGSVTSKDGNLLISPEKGKSATLKLADGTVYNGITTFDLSTIAEQIITITFN